MGLLLAVVTVIAYLPALRGGFIWDDDAYVTQNALLTAPDGLSRIWFSAHRQSQYFPLAFTSLRLERALWGLNPLGYHAVNVLLHAANALLLWQLLRRLAAPGAWLAAAIFALHPVQVESVAWITELKNVQSTFFYLLALLAWVKFTGPAPRARWEFYWVALLCHALALLSKTTACTLPAAFLLVLWWRRQPLGWQRVLQVLPFLLLGLGMGLVSVWWENHLGNYAAPEAGGQYGFLEKGLIATRAVWFYAAKLFWPANLTFSYPRWEIDPRAPGQYLGLLGCGLVAGLLWWRRKDFGRGLTTGVIFFVAALSPLLGFIPLYTFCYSFVADHYQYLACTGLIIPFAALLSKQLMDEGRRRGLGCCLTGGLLLALGVLTWKQTQIYADQKMLWQDTVAKNPGSSMAHNNLGTALAEQGLMQDAIRQFEEAIRLKPDNAEAHDSLGIALGQKGQTDEAIREFEEAVRLKPAFPDPHNNLGVALDKKGQVDEAIRQYQEALRLKPDNAECHNNLGAAYGKKGLIAEAIRQYQEALRLEPDAAEAHYNLGTALSVTGQTEEAIRQYQEALRLKPDFAQARDDLARALRAQPTPAAQ
jgi:Flp pilus assembly protein TadD